MNKRERQGMVRLLRRQLKVLDQQRKIVLDLIQRLTGEREVVDEQIAVEERLEQLDQPF